MAKTTTLVKTLSNEHSVLRWANPKKHLIRDHNKQVINCDLSLFKLRDDEKFIEKHGAPEKNLSVNWVEFFDGTDAEKVKKAAVDFRDGIAPHKLSEEARFAKLNVGEIHGVCEKHAAKVRVVHDATKGSKIKSHGSINQLPQDNHLLLEDLCKIAFRALVKASDVL